MQTPVPSMKGHTSVCRHVWTRMAYRTYLTVLAQKHAPDQVRMLASTKRMRPGPRRNRVWKCRRCSIVVFSASLPVSSGPDISLRNWVRKPLPKKGWGEPTRWSFRLKLDLLVWTDQPGRLSIAPVPYAGTHRFGPRLRRRVRLESRSPKDPDGRPIPLFAVRSAECLDCGAVAYYLRGSPDPYFKLKAYPPLGCREMLVGSVMGT